MLNRDRQRGALDILLNLCCHISGISNKYGDISVYEKSALSKLFLWLLKAFNESNRLIMLPSRPLTQIWSVFNCFIILIFSNTRDRKWNLRFIVRNNGLNVFLNVWNEFYKKGLRGRGVRYFFQWQPFLVAYYFEVTHTRRVLSCAIRRSLYDN